MRTRKAYKQETHHYYNGYSSRSPKIVYTNQVEPDYADYKSKTVQSGYDECYDEKHSKITISTGSQIWDVGPCRIVHSDRCAASAMLWKAKPKSWANYDYLASGSCTFALDVQSVLNAARPDLSDYELLQRAQPAQETMSIPNFLYELKDFKQMSNLINEAFSSPSSVVDTAVNVYRKLRPHLGGRISSSQLKKTRSLVRAGRDLLRQPSEQYLNVQFGILPTVGDLQKLADACINFDDEIRKLKQEAGKTLTRRTSCKCDLEWDDEFLMFNQSMSYQSLSAWKSKCEIEARVRARRRFVGKFSYELPGSENYGVGISNLDTELKRRLLGLRSLSLSDLWQAVPWSWLVDWLVNTSAAMGRDTIVPVYCHQACYVTEIDISFPKFDIYWTHQTSAMDGKMQSLGDDNSARPTFHIYDRVIRDPRDPELQLEALRLKGVNAKQLSLLAAIGISRRRSVAKH